MSIFSLQKSPMKIVLASASPRRKELLLPYFPNLEIFPANIDEQQFLEFPPERMVELLAAKKAETVNNALIADLIIASDTVVVLENSLLEKPENLEHAQKMLLQLSGKTHRVITAVSLFSSEKAHTFSQETLVSFHNLNSELIERYIATKLPMDKAGSYGIQDPWAALFIKEIKGSFYSVMGFPIEQFHQELRNHFPNFVKFMFAK